MQYDRKARRYQQLRRWCAKKDPWIPGVLKSPRLSSGEISVPAPRLDLQILVFFALFASLAVRNLV
jgi:hypothetical protein